MALSQYDLITWLFQKAEPLRNQLEHLRKNPETNAKALAENRYEQAIVATLADLVRASQLPKNTPGVIGKPVAPKAPDTMERVPVFSLDEVLEDAPEPPPAPPAPTVPNAPSQIQQIMDRSQAAIKEKRLAGLAKARETRQANLAAQKQATA